jgi:hypothetical protein
MNRGVSLLLVTLFMLGGNMTRAQDDALIRNSSFEADTPGTQLRTGLNPDPAGWEIPVPQGVEGGVVDAGVVAELFPLDPRSRKNLLIIDDNPAAHLILQQRFSPQTGAALVVNADFRVNRLPTQDAVSLRIYDEGYAKCGGAFNISGVTPGAYGSRFVVRQLDGQIISRELQTGLWYRVEMRLPPAESDRVEYTLTVTEQGTGKTDRYTLTDKEPAITSGYGAIYMRTGIGVAALADVNWDNIRVAPLRGP